MSHNPLKKSALHECRQQSFILQKTIYVLLYRRRNRTKCTGPDPIKFWESKIYIVWEVLIHYNLDPTIFLNPAAPLHVLEKYYMYTNHFTNSLILNSIALMEENALPQARGRP